MTKTIMKEILIVLVLCIAILLILWVILYDYNPINKVLPNKIAYTAPENVKNELEEKNIENTLPGVTNVVYTIQGTDLSNYEKSESYNPSKQNPFVNTADGTIQTTNTTTAGVISGGGTTTSEVTNTTTTSQKTNKTSTSTENSTSNQTASKIK